jgi:hypothetical protein
MLDIKISFTEIDDIHKAAELVKTATESGEPVLVSHRSTSPGEPKYRKWFRNANAALVEKDIRESCRR